MPVAEHRGQRRVLDALRKEERRLGTWMGQDLAFKTHGLERRLHLIGQIGHEHLGAIRILAFGRHGNAPRQRGAKLA